jgi:hypothetical protein
MLMLIHYGDICNVAFNCSGIISDKILWLIFALLSTPFCFHSHKMK